MKIILVIFLFVILGGLFLYQNYYPQDGAGPSPTPEATRTGDDAILVASQRPGLSVTVNFASLTKPGYVVVRENNEGQFGKIVGNSRILPVGEAQAIPVNLIRSTVDGELFFALLYEDSGDGVFSPAVDVPFKDDNGNIIFMRFYIDINADRIEEINI